MIASPRARRWLRFGIELALAVAIYFGARAYLQRDLATGMAPPLTGTLLDGTAVHLAHVNTPTLIYFWATWCPICRSEHGMIESLAHNHRVIAVATQSGDANRVRQFLHDSGWHFPVLVDAKGTLAHAYGVRAVPAFFIVDPAGRIRFVESGYTTGIGLRARLWLAAHTSP